MCPTMPNRDKSVYNVDNVVRENQLAFKLKQNWPNLCLGNRGNMLQNQMANTIKFKEHAIIAFDVSDFAF